MPHITRQTAEHIRSIVLYNWSDEEDDYNHEALEPGNSREGHIFQSLMAVQAYLEQEFGYPHIQPRIENPFTVVAEVSGEELGSFATEQEASEYIATLDGHEDGLYGIDGPSQ